MTGFQTGDETGREEVCGASTGALAERDVHRGTTSGDRGVHCGRDSSDRTLYSLCWLSLKWREVALRKLVFRPSGGDFQAFGSTGPKGFLESAEAKPGAWWVQFSQLPDCPLLRQNRSALRDEAAVISQNAVSGQRGDFCGEGLLSTGIGPV